MAGAARMLGVEHTTVAPPPGSQQRRFTPPPLFHYVDDLLFSKELQLLAQLHKPARFAFRSTSITAQYEAVRAGAGLAVLPAFMADRDPTLVRVLPQQACFTRPFWMSMPEEAKTEPRIQAVWRFLKEVVRERQGELVK